MFFLDQKNIGIHSALVILGKLTFEFKRYSYIASIEYSRSLKFVEGISEYISKFLFMPNYSRMKNLGKLQGSEMFKSDLGEVFFFVNALGDSDDKSSETEDDEDIT